MPKDKNQKVVAWIVLIGFAIVAWFIAPLFLPVYRWLHVDWNIESQRSGVQIEELKREYRMNLFYKPRGEGDPAPWLIMDMEPAWDEFASAEWERFDEYNLAIRCILISDKTGKSPSTLYIGSFDKDRYFTCMAWRFKPGAFGHESSPRPVVLFKEMTWEKLDKGIVRSYGQRNPEDADLYTDEFDDFWEPSVGNDEDEETEE